jgi:hypothetical protein
VHLVPLKREVQEGQDATLLPFREGCCIYDAEGCEYTALKACAVPPKGLVDATGRGHGLCIFLPLTQRVPPLKGEGRTMQRVTRPFFKGRVRDVNTQLSFLNCQFQTLFVSEFLTEILQF